MSTDSLAPSWRSGQLLRREPVAFAAEACRYKPDWSNEVVTFTCRLPDDAGNRIANNGSGGGDPAGVLVGEAGAGSREPYQNVIQCNSITANTGEGIDIDRFDPDFGNNNIDRPSVATATPTLVEGFTNLPATPVPTVQVFYDDDDEGWVYIGDGTVAGTDWTLIPSPAPPVGSFVTATNTLTADGTSEFSDPLEVSPASSVGDLPAPREFKVLRAGAEPARRSARFELSAPERSDLVVRVFDVRGRLVRRLVDQIVDTGVYPVVWDLRDGARQRVAAGRYFVEFRYGGRIERRSVTLAR